MAKGEDSTHKTVGRAHSACHNEQKINRSYYCTAVKNIQITSINYRIYSDV